MSHPPVVLESPRGGAGGRERWSGRFLDVEVLSGQAKALAPEPGTDGLPFTARYRIAPSPERMVSVEVTASTDAGTVGALPSCAPIPP